METVGFNDISVNAYAIDHTIGSIDPSPLAQLTLHHWLNASQLAFHNHRHRKQGEEGRVGERGRREG